LVGNALRPALLVAALATALGAFLPVLAAPDQPGAGAVEGGTPSTAAGTPNEGATIRGIVQDPDGRPVAGVTIRALPSDRAWSQRHQRPHEPFAPVDTASGGDGAFVLGNLSGTSFRLYVDSGAHAPVVLKDVAVGAQLTVGLEAGRDIGGRVVATENGEAVIDATLLACRSEAWIFGLDTCRTGSTDERGAFGFRHVAPAGQVHVSAAGHSTFYEFYPTDDEAARQLLVRLGRGADVTGVVVDQASRPVEGARVFAFPQQQRLDQSVVVLPELPVFSDEEGRFTVGGLPAGAAYSFIAKRDDRADIDPVPVDLFDGRDADGLTLRLVETAELTGRIVDEDDRPVAGLEVAFRDSDDDRARRRPLLDDWIRLDADGAFVAGLPRSGTYDVFLVPGGAEEIVLERLRLESGRSLDVGRIVATRGTAIEGHVNDAQGAPVAGAKVIASFRNEAGSRRRETTTDEEGRFRLAGLGGERVAVAVEADGFLREEMSGVDPGRTDVDFWLEATGGVEGSVRAANEPADGDGSEGLGWFRVIAYPTAADASPTQPRPTSNNFRDDEGAYVLDGLAAGTYTVEARAKGLAPARREEVRVVAGETTEVPTLVLREGLTLRGRVVMSDDEMPVEDARVEIVGEDGVAGYIAVALGSASTDADGSFEIEGLEEGARTLRAEHPGFAASEQRVQLSGDPPNEDVVVQLSGGGTLEGTVRRSDTTPAEGRTVMVALGGQVADARRAETDKDGTYRFRRLRPGRYQVMLISSGGAAPKLDAKTATIEDDETTVVDFDEGASIVVSGRVLRGDDPVPHARLLFVPAGGGVAPEISGVTDADANGAYEVGLDEPGAYTVMVGLGDSGGNSTTRIEVPDDSYVTRDIRLEVDGVSGIVLDDRDGSPVAGAEVTARADTGAGNGLDGLRLAVSDDAGRFSLQHMESGSYTVTAIAPGFEAGTVPVQVGSGQQVDGVEIRLTAGRTVRGRLTDPSGNGIASAQVLAAPSGTIDEFGATAAKAVTDVGGRFQLTVPAEGPIDLTALSANWAPARRTAIVPTGADDEEIAMTAARGGTLELQVLDGAGRPAVGLTVVVRPAAPFLGSALATILRPPAPTRSDGTTVVENLAAGAYEVRAGAGDSASSQAIVSDGARTATVLRLP
jgi:protocatechuate 3,4-dioxygenase beta subunit